MAKLVQMLRDLALLISRVSLGVILIAHGYRRWRFQGIASQIAYLRTFATPHAEIAAWGGTILELAGGLFLVVGALTPLVAAAVVAEQVVVISYTNWYKSIYLLDRRGAYLGGYEYSVTLAVLALLLVVFGAGRLSIDQLFRGSPHETDADYDERSPA